MKATDFEGFAFSVCGKGTVTSSDCDGSSMLFCSVMTSDVSSTSSSMNGIFLRSSMVSLEAYFKITQLGDKGG